MVRYNRMNMLDKVTPAFVRPRQSALDFSEDVSVTDCCQKAALTPVKTFDTIANDDVQDPVAIKAVIETEKKSSEIHQPSQKTDENPKSVWSVFDVVEEVLCWFPSKVVLFVMLMKTVFILVGLAGLYMYPETALSEDYVTICIPGGIDVENWTSDTDACGGGRGTLLRITREVFNRINIRVGGKDLLVCFCDPDDQIRTFYM